ncbi:unnamed protein product [Caenorhabditis angaria]|uniref:RING-type domain-containing protein n=1 Tax=Caenorhabditis angaria TaxID=860376 RepID=A0A9P1N7R2_9PELO|nr:unnamed protein product [Caenorhabditis angaria]
MASNIQQPENNQVENVEEEEDCGICWMPFEATGTCHPTTCSHKYHKNCLKNWLINNQRTCPQCRRIVKKIDTNGVVTRVKMGMNRGNTVRCDCGIDSNQDPAHFICCDRCNLRVHMPCIPLATVPDGQWICEMCTRLDEELAEISQWFHPALFPSFLSQFTDPSRFAHLNIAPVRNPVANLEQFIRGPINRNGVHPEEFNRLRDEEDID